MVVSNVEYEEFRQQRLAENKKRMEQLNLSKLSQALLTSSTPKKSPMKPRRVARPLMEMFSVRRSSRVSDKPQPNYRDLGVEPFERYIRRGGCYKRRDLLNRVYASDENRMYAIDRANDVESGLDSEFPSFVKPMLQSHVTGGFWLGLPNHFCINHLPKDDEMMTLEDEDGNESLSKYLAQKCGLSGGWRGWAIDHELVDGDALVFQLVKPTKFKVYIIRVDQPGSLEDDDNEEKEKQNEDEDEDATEEISEVKPSRTTGKRTRKVHKSMKRDSDDDDDESQEEVSTAKKSNRRKGKKNKSGKGDSSDSDEEEEEFGSATISKDAQSNGSAIGTRRSVRKKLIVDYSYKKMEEY